MGSGLVTMSGFYAPSLSNVNGLASSTSLYKELYKLGVLIEAELYFVQT